MATPLNVFSILIFWLSLWATGAQASDVRGYRDHVSPDYAFPGPASPFLKDPEGGVETAFCAEWNPDFVFRGARCCGGRAPATRRKRGQPYCTPQRSKANFCDEMTRDQRDYIAAVASGSVKDVMTSVQESIRYEVGQVAGRSYCSTNNGFLAWGRPIVPTSHNRLWLKRPDRCTNFATDGMVGMFEHLGRKFSERYPAADYPGSYIVLGDVSAPRGGCLAGKMGRRGHASHTNGRDADVGFIEAKPGRSEKPGFVFTRHFEPEANWWFVKQMFQNPFVCVKAIFLDRSLIKKLAKVAAGDPDWTRYGRYIRHVKRHKEHFHVRVGERPGAPGCPEGGLLPDSENEEEMIEAEREPSLPEGSEVMEKPAPQPTAGLVIRMSFMSIGITASSGRPIRKFDLIFLPISRKVKNYAARL
ncbi:MAG: penicillin-insensitive murein endopeptidase [Bacteriovoracia bacterium]